MLAHPHDEQIIVVCIMMAENLRHHEWHKWIIKGPINCTVQSTCLKLARNAVIVDGVSSSTAVSRTTSAVRQTQVHGSDRGSRPGEASLDLPISWELELER